MSGTRLDAFQTWLVPPGNVSNVDAYRAMCNETTSFPYVCFRFALRTLHSG